MKTSLVFSLLLLATACGRRDNSLDAYLPKNTGPKVWTPLPKYAAWAMYTGYGYAIQYPPSWVVEENKGGIASDFAPLILREPRSGQSMRLRFVLTSPEETRSGNCDWWAGFVESPDEEGASIRPFGTANTAAERTLIAPFAPLDSDELPARKVTEATPVVIGTKQACRFRYTFSLKNGLKQTETAWIFADSLVLAATIFIANGSGATLDSMAQTIQFKE